MRKFFLATAAALMATAAPQVAHAQTTTTMTVEQRGMYEGWPADRRTAYDAWPADYQSYYWTLTPTQQNGWWALTDEQRAMVMGMDPQQRLRAWQAIEAQLAGEPPPASVGSSEATGARSIPPVGPGATSANPGATSANPGATSATRGATTVYTPGNMTPPPASAMNKEYPVCSRTLTDNCRNPGEGATPRRSRR